MSGFKKKALESAVTCLGRSHVQIQKTVIKPNGRCQSLGRTLDAVLKKKIPHPFDIYSVNLLPPQVNVDFFPRQQSKSQKHGAFSHFGELQPKLGMVPKMASKVASTHIKRHLRAASNKASQSASNFKDSKDMSSGRPRLL